MSIFLLWNVIVQISFTGTSHDHIWIWYCSYYIIIPSSYYHIFIVHNIIICRLPKDPSRRKKWLSQLVSANNNHLNIDDGLNCFICSRHFEEKCYKENANGRNVLCESAIPTKFLTGCQNLPGQLVM